MVRCLLEELSCLRSSRRLPESARTAACSFRLTVARPEAPPPEGNGSSKPRFRICLRRTSKAAHMPNVARNVSALLISGESPSVDVLRTTPMPQLNTNEVDKGSTSLSTDT